MLRLLPFDALNGPPVRARWTAIPAASLAITHEIGPNTPNRGAANEWMAELLGAGN